jgi:Tfp pilus assembly protein PilN
MRAVNLLPKEANQRKPFVTQQNLPQVVGAGLGVVVTGALALSFINASSAVKEAQARATDAAARLAATPRPAAPAPVPNAQLANEQSARVLAVSTAIGGRMAWDRVLREFSLVLPDDVWITSLTLNDGGLNIAGDTYSHDSVARLLSRLAMIPELSEVALGSSSSDAPTPDPSTATSTTPTTTTPAGPSTVHFSITAKVTMPAGAAAVAAPPPAPVAPPPTDTTATDSSGATS